jgi:hypothetical protein
LADRNPSAVTDRGAKNLNCRSQPLAAATGWRLRAGQLEAILPRPSCKLRACEGVFACPFSPLTGTRTPSVGGGNYAQELDSFADVTVTYRKVTEVGLWLPSEMTEQYQGPISGLKSLSAGRATTDARYSEFKTFATGSSRRN